MQCFLINLKKDTTRLDFMTHQFTSMNLMFERFDGVNGDSLSEIEKEKLYDKDFVIQRFGKDFTNGEIGCALSHMNIYKHIVKNHIEKAVIFEDDVEIDTINFLEIYKLLERKKDWEYVTLNYDIFDYKFRKKYLWVFHKSLFGKIRKCFLIFCYRPIEIFQQIYGKIFGPHIIAILRPLYLSGCYFITYEGAKKIVSYNSKIQYPADYLPNQVKKKKGLSISFVIPQIIVQKNEIFTSNTR